MVQFVNRFKNILLVYDPRAVAKSAMKRAAMLAEKNKGRLTVVEVIEKLPQKYRMLTSVAPPRDLQELVVKTRQDGLAKLIAQFRKKGVRINAKILVGTPFVEVVREVLRKDHDLVIMSAEGKGGLRERLFGSFSLHLLRKCPCPVWVLKPIHHRRYVRIIAAVGSDGAGGAGDELNAHIMDLASSLAMMDKSELHVVHAWSLEGEQMLAGPVGMSKNDVRKLVHETASQRKGELEKLLKRYDLDSLKHRVHFLKGDPRVLIPRLTSKLSADLIVMGTVCRTGLAGVIIGNTAEELLARVDCSVLAVKPKGFVSPVELKV